MGKLFLPMFKIWIATIIIIAGILAIGFNSYRIMELNAANAFNEQQLFLVREAARGIRELIGNIEGTLRIAADILSSAEEHDRSAEKIFSSVLANSQGQILCLFIANQDGTIIYNYPPRSFPVSADKFGLKSMLTSSAANRAPFISNITTISNNTHAILSFIIGVPMADSDQQHAAWICCIADFNSIKNKFIYPIRSGKTGYAWMVDNRGILIAHPNKSMEGIEAIEASKRGLPDFSSRRLEEIVNQKMIKGQEGTGEYVSGWHAEAKGLTKKLIAYTPISLHGIGWTIGVSTPYNEVLDQLSESTKRLALFLGSFIGTILIGALWLLWQEKKNQQVNQNLQWSQEVFNGITDGITIVDQYYRVLMVNEAVCRWQNKPLDSLLGKPCHEVFLQRDELCLGCPAKETFATGQPAFRERVSITLGGKKYYFHLYTFPLKDSSGKTVRVVEYVKDVTRERLLQSENIQNERLAIIGKMSAQVAHEIRNPLSALTLNVDLLEDEIQSYKNIDIKESGELIATIKYELHSLHNIIDEYLQFTRLPKIKPVKGDINKLLEEILYFLDGEMRKSNILLKTYLQKNIPFAKLDYEQLRRAFINIIRNAVEAMKGGGTLDITTRLNEKWIEIKFMDNGAGISDENLEQIFTPFFSTKAGGTGLGLSITKHIITEHKGEIYCESRQGEGAHFTINIPQWEE
jgi:two-component system, NtrC family, sensor kinase